MRTCPRQANGPSAGSNEAQGLLPFTDMDGDKRNIYLIHDAFFINRLEIAFGANRTFARGSK